MKVRLVLATVLASFAVSVGAYYESLPSRTPLRFETAAVTRGDIVSTVACTGTLQALKTVEVGTQANGVVKELHADFNSVVHKGDVIARLDSSAIDAQIAQGKAAVDVAQAGVEQLRVTQADADRQLARAEALHARALVDEADLEAARAAAAEAAADVRAAEAEVARARASVAGNLTNREHTIVTAPISGIVISRNVDVGQTVVSNMQAQTLFEIAEDLSKMQLNAEVDESDVAPLRAGDPVTFTVDAYPGDSFTGTVAQVRVNPNIDQNVVSYTTVIDVANPTLKLRPGMTASVTIRTETRRDVLRVPATAVRFKPNDELFALLHQDVPAPVHGRSAAELRAVSQSTVPASEHGHQRQVWVVRNGRLQAIPIRAGLGNGTDVEVVDGNLSPGDRVVLNAITAR